MTRPIAAPEPRDRTPDFLIELAWAGWLKWAFSEGHVTERDDIAAMKVEFYAEFDGDPE